MLANFPRAESREVTGERIEWMPADDFLHGEGNVPVPYKSGDKLWHPRAHRNDVDMEGLANKNTWDRLQVLRKRA